MSLALVQAGQKVVQVAGRDKEKRDKLVALLTKEGGREVESLSSEQYGELYKSDIVIVATSDGAIKEVADQLFKAAPAGAKEPILFHSSGASPIDYLSQFERRGIFYPLMTLSATKPIEFSLIPFLLEGNTPEVNEVLVELAYALNCEYKFVTFEERSKMHLAAVFTNNFVNHLLGVASDVAGRESVLLMPLAIETVRKAFLYPHPSLVQTGPAIRGDEVTIERHLEMLKENEEAQELYRLMSEKIGKSRKQ